MVLLSKSMDIVLASNNQGKIQEISAFLAPLNITIIPQTALGIDEVEENGSSFIENALIKARHASKQSGKPALADDSGLSVKVLRGAPGIYSARFAHNDASDSENIAHLLNTLKNTPEEQRQASFICVLCLVRHADDPIPITAQSMCSGSISSEPVGTNGFGYDPVFICEDGRSIAQLSASEKQAISHRGKALRKLYTKIQTNL